MTLPNLWEFPGGKVEKEEDILSVHHRDISRGPL